MEVRGFCFCGEWELTTCISIRKFEYSGFAFYSFREAENSFPRLEDAVGEQSWVWSVFR